MDKSTIEIGKKLRTARRAKDISQTQLAEMVGISDTSYARIERGEVNVTLKHFVKILKALNLKFEEIIPL